MQVTRRYWATIGLAGLLASAAIILARPLLIVGAAILGAWLLGQQWLFVRTATQLHAELKTSQTLARTQVTVDDPVTGSLSAQRPPSTLLPVSVTIKPGIPFGATKPPAQSSQLSLPTTGSEATTTFTVQWPVASHTEFNPPTVTVTDSQGLFRTTFSSKSVKPPTVTVTPQQPQSLHVGAGGDRMKGVMGDHPTGKKGPGIEPETVREYAPGDALRQIDWKATARSDDLYVRTYTEQTEFETALFVDHRATMKTGTPGETKFDYAREVALAVADHANNAADSLGFAAIGDGGITERRPPGATVETYSQLRTLLHDLTPTQPTEETDVQPPRHNSDKPGESLPNGTSTPDNTTPPSARVARQKARTLTNEPSEFATTLQPFYTAAQTYVQRVTTKPLYTTVQTYLTTGGVKPDRTVILTDDTQWAEIRETVKAASQHSEQVLVYITPTILFEPAGLSEMDTAYTKYAEFETFRQQLTELDGVTAFEVAPGDRLQTLQSAFSTNNYSEF